MDITERFISWLSAPRTPIRLVVLGLLLGAPSLGVGLFMDDFAHRAAFMGLDQIADIMRSPVLMFSFTDGDPTHTRGAIESGLFPWWTSETVLLNFWRPLTAATHAIDHALWPDSPALMHAHNLFWFAAAILAVAALYRRIGPGMWVTGLAGYLFVVDESHGMPVVWIANRNAMLALFFGTLCLLSHVRWRDSGRLRWLAMALTALAASVHCNEGGIATCGYLFAYAVMLDQTTWRRRMATLIPYGLLVVVWRVSYSAMGFGALGSPTYIDPGASPVRFGEALVQRAPVLLSTQLLNLPSEPFDFLPIPLKAAFWVTAVITILVCAIALKPVLRVSARARFWTLGMLLSLIPASSTFPSGRLLVFASVGGAALLAEYLVWAMAGDRGGVSLRRALAYVMILTHVIIAPFALAGTGIVVRYLAKAMIETNETIPYPDDIEGRRLFLINAPNYFFSTYANVYRALNGLPVPLAMHTLSPNAPLPSKMTVTRVDEDTLRFDAADGFRYLLFRDTDKPFKPGDKVVLENLTVEILEVDAAGRAMAVHYHFRAPLESAAYCWMQMNMSMRFEPYTPPAVGETQVFYGG